MGGTKAPHQRTRLGRGIRKAMDACGFTYATDAAQAWGASAYVIKHWLNGGEEPSWLRTLRAIKRLTGLSWDELLDGR